MDWPNDFQTPRRQLEHTAMYFKASTTFNNETITTIAEKLSKATELGNTIFQQLIKEDKKIRKNFALQTDLNIIFQYC